MKLILWMFGATTLLLAGGYFLLFTQSGNNLIKPYIQNKLNAKTPLEIRLEKFRLTPSKIALSLGFPGDNSIYFAGRYDLFAKSIDGRFDASLQELSAFSQLLERNISGALQTQGTMRGDLKQLKVDGELHAAKGGGTYSLTLQKMQPATFRAEFAKMDAAQLLQMAGEQPYFTGELRLDAELRELAAKVKKGAVDLRLVDGELNAAVIEKRLQLTLPRQKRLQLHAKAKLEDVIGYEALLEGAQSIVKSSGTFAQQTQTLQGVYSVDVARMELFEPLIGYRLQGPLRLHGNIKADPEYGAVSIDSGLASGQTKLLVGLKEFRPSSLKGTMHALELEKLLYFLNQPRYASGLFQSDLEITKITQEGLWGEIDSALNAARFNEELLQKRFGLDLGGHSAIELKARTVLDAKRLRSDLRAESPLATLRLPEAEYNMQTGRFESPFSVDIEKLSRLNTLAKRKLQGGFVAEGKIAYDKVLQTEATTASLGGETRFTQKGNTVRVEASGILAQKLLSMLTYPESFAGAMDANLDYDTETKKGTLVADLKEGHFTQSAFTDTLLRHTGVDLTVRDLSKADVATKINDRELMTALDFAAPRVNMASRGIYTDLATKRIKGELECSIKQEPYTIKIDGYTNKMAKAFDYGDLLAQEAKKQMRKKAEEKLQKELGKELGEGASKLLKGLFR